MASLLIGSGSLLAGSVAGSVEESMAEAAPITVTADKTTLLPAPLAAPLPKKTAITPATLPEQNLLPQLLQVTFGLLLVLAVIGAVAWLARRFGQFQVNGRSHLRIIGGLQLGTRERIVLIQVGEQQLLIGVAPGHVEKLLVLETPIDVDTALTQPVAGVFAKRLAELIRSKP